MRGLAQRVLQRFIDPNGDFIAPEMGLENRVYSMGWLALGEVLLDLQCDDGLWNPQPGNQTDAPPWARLAYSSDCAMTVCALADFPR